MSELPKECGYKIVKVLKKSDIDQVLEVQSLNSGALRVMKTLGSGIQGPLNPSEIVISSTIKYDYILPIYNIMDASICGMEGVTIFMDKATGDMYDIIRDPTLEFKQRLIYAFQIVNAVKVLHSAGYLHLDIKIDNVLAKANRSLLMDFGLSLKVDNVETGGQLLERVGTIPYMAPEILDNEVGPYTYNEKVDVWALGHLILAVLTNYGINIAGVDSNSVKSVSSYLLNHFDKPDFRLKLYGMLLANIQAPVNQQVLDVLEGCFQRDPTTRFTVDQILASTLFDPVRDVVTTNHSIENVIRSKPVIKYTEVLLELRKFFLENWGHLDARFFFVTVDLFYRSVDQVEKLKIRDPAIEKKVLLRVAATCAWIISKTIVHYKPFVFEALRQWAGGDPKYYKTMETSITVSLGGNLLPDYIYEACLGARHLILSYKHLLFNSDNYHNIDLVKWVEMMGDAGGDKKISLAMVDAYSASM